MGNRAVQNELIIRHRELFETKLALVLREDESSVAAVIKIAQKVRTIFIDYKNEIEPLIASNSKITQELFDPKLYGSLQEDKQYSPYQQMLSVLDDTIKNPFASLHVQMIFIHRIYDALSYAKDKEEQKQAFVSQIFPSELFSDRARIPKTKIDDIADRKLGICHLKFFQSKIDSTAKNISGKQRFDMNPASSFYQDATESELPTVCGPSGHTGSLMLLSALMNVFDEAEWHKYSMIVSSYLVLAGCHTFHECMIIANQVTSTYQENGYHTLFGIYKGSAKIEKLVEENAALINYRQ